MSSQKSHSPHVMVNISDKPKIGYLVGLSNEHSVMVYDKDECVPDSLNTYDSAKDFIKKYGTKLILTFGLPIAVDLIRNYVFMNAEQRAMVYEQQKQALAINAMNLENKDVMRQSHQQVLEQQRQQLRKNKLILKDAELKHFYEKKAAIEQAIAGAQPEEKKELEKIYQQFCADQARALMGKNSYKDTAAFTIKL